MLNWVELGEVKRVLEENDAVLYFGDDWVGLLVCKNAKLINVYACVDGYQFRSYWETAPSDRKCKPESIFYKAYVDCLNFKKN